MAKHALKPVHSHNKMKLMIPIVVAGALLSSSVAAQADTGHSITPATSVAQSVAPQNATSFTRVALVQPDISAPATAKLSFTHSIVKTIPAPKPVVKPVVKVEGKEIAKTAVKATTKAATSLTNPGNISTDLTASTGASGASDSFGEAIAAKALSQIGVQQDCTMLVTNSLLAVGIRFHGWPSDYAKLGKITTNPQAGDLILYNDGGMGLPHIAVFLSPGKAVHGGWNGHTTAVGPVNVGSGPIYIHVTR